MQLPCSEKCCNCQCSCLHKIACDKMITYPGCMIYLGNAGKCIGCYTAHTDWPLLVSQESSNTHQRMEVVLRINVFLAIFLCIVSWEVQNYTVTQLGGSSETWRPSLEQNPNKNLENNGMTIIASEETRTGRLFFGHSDNAILQQINELR